MGLFDSIANQVLGSLINSDDKRHSGLLEALGGLVNNPQGGGLHGLVDAFGRHGLGEVVSSWVGTGKNLPISAVQIQQVLGSEQVRVLAEKLGFSPEELSGQMAEMLPRIIDGMTPEGRLPEDSANRPS